jgi:hypothetical protein
LNPRYKSKALLLYQPAIFFCLQGRRYERIIKLLHQREQAKLQWLQDPSEINGDSLNNVRHEASRHFRNKKREYLKDNINELEMNSKNKNIRYLYRGLNELNRGYQARNTLVKDENGDLLADSHNILNRWRNYFPQLLNVHNVSDVSGFRCNRSTTDQIFCFCQILKNMGVQ